MAGCDGRRQLAIEIDKRKRSVAHRYDLRRDHGGAHGRKPLLGQRRVDLPVGLVIDLHARLQPSEPEAHAAQLLELPVGPQQVPSTERADDMADVVPEPVHELAHLLGVDVRDGRRPTAMRRFPHPVLVEEDAVRQLERQLACPRDDQLEIDPVGEDQVKVGGVTEVLDQERLADGSGQLTWTGKHTVVGVIRDDQADVEVGIRIGSARGVRSVQQHRPDAIVRLPEGGDPIGHAARHALVHGAIIGATPIDGEAIVRGMRWLERHAWWGLLLITATLVIIGVTDVIRGAASDRAIPQALTGMTLDELEASGPEAYRMFDFMTRVNGWSLVLAGALATAILVFSFRKGSRWAWGVMWLLPVWAMGVPLFYLVAGIEEGQPLPPPMISGPIVALLAVGILIVTTGRFFRHEVQA